MEGSKILYVSQEITPYLPETEMSVIGRNLPQGIQERGKEIRTFMPRYGCINERRNQLHEVIRLSGMNLIIDDSDHPLIIKVASIQAARMQVYFIDNEDYFHRRNILMNKEGKFFDDNDERAIFFARGVLETVRKLQWSPDIIHCHGWFTGFIPLYIKRYYNEDPLFMDSKIITSVYDNEFNNELNMKVKEKLLWDGIPENDISALDKPSYVNVIKTAINMSDGIIFGSEKINPEIKKHIENMDIQNLPYQNEEGYIDAYDEFYNHILSEVMNDHK
jgi:starch synthase